MVIMNLRDFEKLDKPTQEALLKAAADAERKGWERMRGYTDESLGILQKNKMTVVKPSPQLMGDMKKIGDEMLGDWLKQAGRRRQGNRRRVSQEVAPTTTTCAAGSTHCTTAPLIAELFLSAPFLS